jgi:hypothetical protein
MSHSLSLSQHRKLGSMLVRKTVAEHELIIRMSQLVDWQQKVMNSRGASRAQSEEATTATAQIRQSSQTRGRNRALFSQMAVESTPTGFVRY